MISATSTSTSTTLALPFSKVDLQLQPFSKMDKKNVKRFGSTFLKGG
jgi:hypothetical protein